GRAAGAAGAGRLAPPPGARGPRPAGRGRCARRGGDPRGGCRPAGHAHDPAHRRGPGSRRQRGGGGPGRDVELTSGASGGGARGATESRVKRVVWCWLACWLAGAACRSSTIPEAARFPAGTGCTARRLAGDGTPPRYLDTGRGTPVVFLHGLGASMYAWRKNLAPIVAAGYRVI